jgi:hypothetical protein
LLLYDIEGIFLNVILGIVFLLSVMSLTLARYSGYIDNIRISPKSEITQIKKLVRTNKTSIIVLFVSLLGLGIFFVLKSPILLLVGLCIFVWTVLKKPNKPQ